MKSTAALGTLLMLLLAACGGDDKSDTETDRDVPTAMASEESATTAPRSGSPTVTQEPTPTEVSTPSSFTVVETAYTSSSAGDGVYVHWVAVIENPNQSHYGVFPTLTITARDDAGAVLGSQDQVLGEFPPGVKIAFAGQLTAAGEPVSVQFTPGKVDWHETKTKSSDYPPFTATQVSLNAGRSGGNLISGDIHNPYGGDVDQLAITALLRDEAGTLVGGHTTFIDGPAAMSSRPFSFSTYGTPSNAAQVEIMAMPWTFGDTWSKLAAGR